MRMSERIKAVIEEGLPSSCVDIVNESDRHIGHAGHDGTGESHFKLEVVCNEFEGLSRVQRQRVIYSLVEQLFDENLHALSMRLLTQAEARLNTKE
ncbi:MAG: BolA family transcriptional regulator [Alphaproteobacteria bacterium]|nr:BolA family transcriptional regulator [Alphaproteobacteria bacterium]